MAMSRLVPLLEFNHHANNIAMRNHACKRGAMVYDAVGATRIIRIPPGPSTHNLGTCRQSARREEGVWNEWGQAHDVKNLFISDGSQFTTSTAENPTLTIVALAIRQADYILTKWRRRMSKTNVLSLAFNGDCSREGFQSFDTGLKPIGLNPEEK
jgi:choline dehydrogenase-like flavoprotein